MNLDRYGDVPVKAQGALDFLETDGMPPWLALALRMEARGTTSKTA
jgi:hypothetical protein